MNTPIALFVIAAVSFTSMVAVLNEWNQTKRDITNGVVQVQGKRYYCLDVKPMWAEEGMETVETLKHKIEKLKTEKSQVLAKIARQKMTLDEYRVGTEKAKLRAIQEAKLNEFFRERLLKLFGKDAYDKVFNTVEKPEELESPLVKVIKALRAENEELKFRLDSLDK